ncbi:MAG: hypothetical protein ACK4K7_02930 [Allosphingosinicella sp.]|uniref:hypothetical protein n=1 Tax=Allosphingosinicella sp. TaxID=2823234 RepID=UPI003960E9B2
MDRLICTYVHAADHDDDFGWLAFEVITHDFSARSGFWVHWRDVADFAADLSRYPIAPDDPVRARWGFETLQGDDLILGLEIAAANRRGGLVARVEVADHLCPRHRLRTSFATSYAAVAAFAAALSAVVARTADAAVLSGE